MKTMTFRTGVLAAAVVAAFTVVGVVAQTVLVPSGPNKLEFPHDYANGELYATVDRHDTKQYREFYTSAAAVKAAREGKPIPEGTIITLAAYAAKLDDKGVPIKDANGRFIKDKLVAVNPMIKKAEWGREIPESIRNGDWVYQSFTPDGKVNDKANLTACYQCHLPFAKEDFLTNMAKLAGKFPSTASVVARTGPTDVAIAGFKFGPDAIKVTVGDNVTWSNADDTPHQVTLVGPNGQRSELMLKGQTATLKFDAAGNIDYICGLHPGMKGAVQVASK